MTTEQHEQLIQCANDFRSELYSFENSYGIIDLKNAPYAEIIIAGAKMMHLIESIESYLFERR
jgi:hypothetical protein